MRICICICANFILILSKQHFFFQNLGLSAQGVNFGPDREDCSTNSGRFLLHLGNLYIGFELGSSSFIMPSARAAGCNARQRTRFGRQSLRK